MRKRSVLWGRGDGIPKLVYFSCERSKIIRVNLELYLINNLFAQLHHWCTNIRLLGIVGKIV